MQENVTVISNKSMVLITQKKGLDHTSGASEKFFESKLFITLEKAQLANRTNITFVNDLVRFRPLNHICFKEWIMVQG